MSKSLKAFLTGVLVTLLVIITGYFLIFNGARQDGIKHDSPTDSNDRAPAADSVVIQSLPPQYVLAGNNVAFEGKTEIPQAIGGMFADHITIVKFDATGENAHKSAIKIAWEDGTIQLIPPGKSNIALTPDRRAKAISIVGYSMHERKIFRDSARPGRLTWEIRYELVH